MKKAIKIAMLAATLGVVSCAYREVYTPISNVSSVNASGKIVVYEKGETVDREYKILGTLQLKDSGFTLRCGYYDALPLAKERARELGGDAIVIKKVNRANFWSTCDRFTIEIIEFE